MSANSPSRPLVAFDFDGTLTHTDSVMAYLKFSVGPMSYYGRALSRPLELCDSVFGNRDGSSKLSLINAILGPMSESAFKLSIAKFHDQFSERIFRKDALERWRWHGDQGHERIIVSGSLQPLLLPFAEILGADLLIATEAKIDTSQDQLMSLGPNCVRAEKVRRLQQAYGDNVKLISAYGDTRGDREMLAIADQAFYRLFKDKA